MNSRLRNFLFWLLLPALLGAENPFRKSAPALYQDAGRLQKAGKYAAALKRWRRFLREYPKDPAVGQAYQGLGTCLLKTGDWPEAIDALNQALKLLSHADEKRAVRWNLAIALYSRAERSNDAEHRWQVVPALRAILEDAKAPPKQQALAGFYLARTEIALGEKAAAKKQLEKLLEAPADKTLVPTVLETLAGLAEEAKDWPTAIRRYRELLRDHPNQASAGARLGLADALLQAGQRKEAETQYGFLVKQGPQATADYAHFRWAELAGLRADFKAAGERWTSYLELYPKSPYRARALRQAAEAHWHLQQFDRAAADYGTWLQENPTHEDRPRVQAERGLAQVAAAHYAAAAADLKKALDRLPEGELRMRVLLGLARASAKSNQPAAAVGWYLKVFQAKPSVSEAEATRYEAVRVALAAKDMKQALAWTDDLVARFPKHAGTAQAQVLAARALAEQGKFEAAGVRCRWLLAAKDAAAQPAALYLAGFCALKLRKFEEAIGHYRALRDRYPTSEHAGTAAYSLGVAWEGLKAPDKALAAYQDVVQNFAGHPLAGPARKRITILQANR